MESLSVVFRTVSKGIIYLAVMIGFILFYKGHSAPGGGFIGGLCIAGAYVLGYLVFGIQTVNQKIHPVWILGIGLSISFVTGLLPMFSGLPFMLSVELFPHFWSVFFFDLGVLCVVIGTVAVIISLVAGEKI